MMQNREEELGFVAKQRVHAIHANTEHNQCPTDSKRQ